MDRDSILGILILICSLACITYLTVWSRSLIKRIAKKQTGTLRDIVKEFHRGR